MSDNIKLIIEIDKRAYKACQQLRTNNDDGITGLCAVNAIANGTPLDDVKAEIEKELCYSIRDEYSQRQNDYCDGVEFAGKRCLEILDNIGKAESENK